MDRTQIDSEHVVQRYLSDQLSGAEEEAFEAYCEQHPEIYREVDRALRLQEGFAALRDRNELSRLVSKDQRPSRIWGVAAAVILAALVLGWVWRQPGTVAGPMLAGVSRDLLTRSRLPLSVASSVTFVNSRDRQSVTEIALPPAQAAIQVRIFPSQFAPGSRYRVSVERVDVGVDVGRGAGRHEVVLTAGSDRFVVLYLDSAQLTPGKYCIELLPSGAGQASAESETFFFQVK
jgi:hypothetical protein